MTERDHEKAQMRALESVMPGALVWKIHDTVTGGQPDLEVNWRGATSKLELKVLRETQNIHDVWEDQRQLHTCWRYEQTTGRCWVIAYRHRSKFFPEPVTRIYKPSRLLHEGLPQASESREFALCHGSDLLTTLWHDGVLELTGWDYRAVATLVRMTHVCER